MMKRIEKLLRITADLQQFSEGAYSSQLEELSEEDLTFVAAAAQPPVAAVSEQDPAVITLSKK